MATDIAIVEEAYTSSLATGVFIGAGRTYPLFVLGVTDEIRHLYENVALAVDERGDSGLNIYFPEDVTIEPRGTSIIDLKVRARCVMAGRFCAYQVYPRSSIGKTPLSLANSIGLMDKGYQGTVRVAIRNNSDDCYHVEAGTALFQLAHPSLESPGAVAIDASHAIFTSPTARGGGGFGSTDSVKK